MGGGVSLLLGVTVAVFGSYGLSNHGCTGELDRSNAM